MASAPAIATRRYHVDDLDSFPDDGKRRELVAGQVVEWDMANYEHGSLVALLTVLIGIFVRERRLGQLVDADALVKVQRSDFDARGSDIAFYRRERIPTDRQASATAEAPDLVIEILSPTDRAAMVEAKVGDWLRAGVQLL
ncbi:MAG TPA: Uma2 family endonuclease [Chloroflexota bacterium]|jgi:Uma2 family endonuclease